MVEFLHCLTCETACCKGTAVHLFQDEYDRIKAKFPEIEKWVKRLTKNYIVLELIPQCPFLNEQNLCNLRLHGMEPPLGCQFGPFYISQELSKNNELILTVGRNSICPSADDIQYDNSFKRTFMEIVKKMQEDNPNMKLIIRDTWLLEGKFW